VAVTALSSGAVHAGFGWNALNLALLPALAISLVMVLRRPAMARPA